MMEDGRHVVVVVRHVPAPAAQRWDSQVLDAIRFVLHANGVVGVRTEICDGGEIVWFSAEAVVALLDAGSGDHFESSCTGSWADSIVLAAEPGARLDVAARLAEAADCFDAIAWAALEGPVQFATVQQHRS